MYVQIVTYNLNGVSEQEYIDIAHQVSPQFNSMSGLHAKVWLGQAEENAFGAVYFWEDREAMERFIRSDLFEATYPGFANVASQGFEVYEHLTKATQPMVTILEDAEEGWTAAPASPVEAPAAPPPPERPARPARKAAKQATPRKATAKAAKKVAKATKAAKKSTKTTKAAKSVKKSARKGGGGKATAKRSRKSAS